MASIPQVKIRQHLRGTKVSSPFLLSVENRAGKLTLNFGLGSYKLGLHGSSWP